MTDQDELSALIERSQQLRTEADRLASEVEAMRAAVERNGSDAAREGSRNPGETGEEKRA